VSNHHKPVVFLVVWVGGAVEGSGVFLVWGDSFVGSPQTPKKKHTSQKVFWLFGFPTGFFAGVWGEKKKTPPIFLYFFL